MELVCPAGSLPALDVALASGADAVYIGFADDTNARHFQGLNFTPQKAAIAASKVHAAGKKLFVAINTYAQAGAFQRWQRAVDQAADLGVDALILADMGVMHYARSRHPDLNLHLSVQGSATNAAALTFYHQHFGITRAVLPRVLSLKQVQQLAAQSPVALEVFGFGSLCIMAEGRCHLSSYITGQSPNMNGVCSPASAVQWQPKGEGMDTRLQGVLIDRFDATERAGYPTLCKGRFDVEGKRAHALEEPTSLNTLSLLPALQAAGIGAVKLEGRQRGPAYIGQVVNVWRQALDALQRDPTGYHVAPEWNQCLGKHAEGVQTTLGAYDRPWQ
ncbi:ubiquinone anaerobic biosynthesis protein UbiU [Simiduia agarivorans]|uniref:Ubiquinone biosynthesis protein UbiU n=1 Tax=Simiduia agarivorans (strain DSM 21679 / JCM 13881 / BCRC 17597 / SA1) TaxID=1117647 RepID=K4KMB9_SIMAS|nr:peptidase U32 family protein [Simiduia agarivorans]AFV00147.1 putative protease [Simiduia agarivorans SA1 = DSM 21679]